MDSKSAKVAARTKKRKSKPPSDDAQACAVLTLSELQSILQSPPHRANRHLSKYNDFIQQAQTILNALHPNERRTFLNNHLDEAKLNKWYAQRSKFMDVSVCSFQHSPLTVSFYNFTYAHTSIAASKTWYNFIHLILDFEQGAAECDLKHCDLPSCKRHLTIIDQLYAYVNTSDDSFSGINTQEFGVRGGFKLVLKAFNSAGVNNPIPPIILCHTDKKQHEFLGLQHFASTDYEFLYCISPNEVRFSWIKQMLHNGHPIMSCKASVDEVLQRFYPVKKVLKHKDTNEDDISADESINEDDYDLVVSETAEISMEIMNAIDVLCWLLATLPSLLDVRTKQKTLLKKEFDKYEETAANATLIDTMLDYLYWNETYIHQVLHRVHAIIKDDKNEKKVFNYIHNEYGTMISLVMFIKPVIDLHMERNRDVLSQLFDDDVEANNRFYFKFIKIIFNSSTMIAKMDQYFPFIISKIVNWNKVSQALFDEFLIAVLAYIERYVSDKSVMMRIVNLRMPNSDKILSKMVDAKRERNRRMVSYWIVKLLHLLDNKTYTQQFIYRLGVLHFQFQNDPVEQFTLQLYEQLSNEFEFDVVRYHVTPDTHHAKTLIVARSESILWLLCRCCFDKAIQLFLGALAAKDEAMDHGIFETKRIGDTFHCNNVFLCLAQSVMPDAIVHTKEMEQIRLHIFKMLVEFGIGRGQKKGIETALLIKDNVNGIGKNAVEYAADNLYQSLCVQMKDFLP